MKKSLTANPPANIDLRNLGRKTIVAISLQIAGVLLTYLIQILLARWMGKVEYGLYAYTMAWCLTLAIPAGLGFPKAVLRFVSEYRVREEWGKMRGVLFSSWQFTFASGLAIALAGSAGFVLIDRYYAPAFAPALTIGVWLIPLLSLLNLQEDMGRGTKSLLLAYGPSKVLWPILVLAGCFWVSRWEDWTLTGIGAIHVTIATLVGVILFQLALIWLGYVPEIASASIIYNRREWFKVALPLLFHRAFREILRKMDVIMVGTLIGTEVAGIYNAAASTALWVSFMLVTVNLVVAPIFTRLYTQKDATGLQKVVSISSLWITWAAILVALLLIFAARPILGLFGSEFVAARWSLKILVLGQFTNALCGSVGTLLVMTGHQNKVLMVSSTCAIVNLVLDAIAIPLWGMNGAAVATTAALMIYNIWGSVLVFRNTGIFSSAAIEFIGRIFGGINRK
ncbi:MAG: oligosaccharide flippase family protein [Cyanobacteria bacterium SBLK]|nr:oligosaccharide flippase family protein [Cyanobacteria bacterium SBLK]